MVREDLGQHNVIVTAHPDDEVLWSGGLPIRFPELKWTIICCSVPRHDSIRAWKFFDACEVLGSYAKLIPVTETEPSEPLRNLEVLDLTPYDCIITHNQWGEYGHRHHQYVNQYITDVWKHKKILTFGFRKGEQGKKTLHLGADESYKKLQALKKYDHLWPYETGVIPKWEALLHRYVTLEGLPFDIETYDAQP